MIIFMIIVKYVSSCLDDEKMWFYARNESVNFVKNVRKRNKY